MIYRRVWKVITVGIFLVLALPGLAACRQKDTLLAEDSPGALPLPEIRITQGTIPQPPTSFTPIRPFPAGVTPAISSTAASALPSPSATLIPSTMSVVKVCSPLEGIPLTELLEIVSNPYQASRPGKDDGHPALDFAFYNWRGFQDIAGHPVLSVLNGTVAALGFDRLPYGNMVMVETSWNDLPKPVRLTTGGGVQGSLYVLYAHLQDAPMLDLGQAVGCGQQLGLAGKTGRSGAPHLHLEARFGPAETRFSQMVFYDTRANEEEIALYQLWSMSGVYTSLDPKILLIPPDQR